MHLLAAGNLYDAVKERHESTCAKLTTIPPVFALLHKGRQVKFINCTKVQTYFGGLTYVNPQKSAKRRRFITRWLLDEDMRTCEEIVVDPTCPPGPMPPDCFNGFNIFPGYPSPVLFPVSYLASVCV